jgi:MbtH protein
LSARAGRGSIVFARAKLDPPLACENRARAPDWARSASPGSLSKEEDMTNPFEDENGVYHVLVNEEGQHSLWPSFIKVPEGWTIVHESDSRVACLEFINQHWTDMRPNSLIASMEKLSASEPPNGSPSEPKDNMLILDGKTKH